MADTTVKKIDSDHSPTGEMGQIYLASGTRVSMRLWRETLADAAGKEPRCRSYETVGYVIRGKAELDVEGQTVILSEGDSWVVPEGALHNYTVLEDFEAVEATAPPADVRGRDDAIAS